jgi:hypothetical protein
MADTIVPKFITTLFKNEIERIHKVLLYEISKDYKIPLDDLNKKYIPTVDINNDNIVIVRKRNYNINLPIEQRCIAFNSKHKQCKRSKGTHEHFCNVHMNHQKHGTIGNLIQNKGKTDITNNGRKKLY